MLEILGVRFMFTLTEMQRMEKGFAFGRNRKQSDSIRPKANIISFKLHLSLDVTITVTSLGESDTHLYDGRNDAVLALKA